MNFFIQFFYSKKTRERGTEGLRTEKHRARFLIELLGREGKTDGERRGAKERFFVGRERIE
jgi:hypothetical protein